MLMFGTFVLTVARLHQKASQIEKAVPHYNFGRVMGRL
ncbi:hypothetical protein [Limosilactobacillus fermentum]